MSNAAERQLRAQWVFERLLVGTPSARLVAATASRWGISRRQARSVVRQAHQQLAADIGETVDRKELLARLIHQSEVVYAKALEAGQLPAAQGTVNTIARLVGIGADRTPNPRNPYRTAINSQAGRLRN